jgi:hypothetical protein
VRAVWVGLAFGWIPSSGLLANQPVTAGAVPAAPSLQDENFFYGYREGCPPNGKVHVLVAPDGLSAAIDWVTSNDYTIRFPAWEPPGLADQHGYSAMIEVPEGGELEAFEALRGLEWAKASINNAICPRGPGQAILVFYRQLFEGLADQGNLRVQLSRALTMALPKVPQPAVRAEGRGLHYTTTLQAPAAYFGVRDYPGWWLKVNMSFGVAHLGTASRPRDEIDMSLDDGWLAKYPAGTKPPEGYGYHLGPDGSNKYNDFSILLEAQGIIAARIGKIMRANDVSSP